MIKYEIEGGNLPVVICHPTAGETICTEGGAMSWMSPNMEMKTAAGGFKKAIGRLFSGETAFLNEYTAVGGEGVIAFASKMPGTIIPYRVTPGNAIVAQKGSFLCMEKSLNLSVYFQKRLGAAFFGGEGFIMQKIAGDGLVFLEIDGYCKEYELQAGEQVVVDTGYLAAMSESCRMDITTVKGIKNKLFGGEGFFHTVITGPGKVYLQTMPICQMAQSLIPYLPQPSGDNDGEGGIRINFGK